MDAFESVQSFYPTPLLAYDATLHGLSYEPVEQPFNIDLESFAGIDTVANPASLLRRQVSGSQANFEDVFSDVNSNYDQQFGAEQQLQEAKTPPLETDDLRLKFSGPEFYYPLLDYAYRTAPVAMEAQLNGMFFAGVLDSPSLSMEDRHPTTKSVTCYRRNLFGITGTISMLRSLRYVSLDNGEQMPIVSMEVCLSATESMENAAVKLISVPFKSSNAPPDVEEKGDKEPPNIPVDLMTGTEMEPGYATFQLNWKRLQFRSSTANNGRRKELQQHFILRISLRALLSNGQHVTLCDLSKGPIVVRGRSPRNFQAKGPTSGSISGRKPSTLTRHATTDGNGATSAPPIKSEADFNYGLNDFGMDHDAWPGAQNGPHKGAMTALPPDTFKMRNYDFAAQSSPDISRYIAQPVPAPIKLSLVTDESTTATKPKRPAADPLRGGSKHKVPRLNSVKRPSFSLGLSEGKPLDNDNDELYEYFPLGLDDMQEPVDAIYRPHVVHHIAVPSSTDSSKMKSKRYFSNKSPG